MSLTGRTLPILLVAVSGVLFALIVLGRPRFRRPWARASGRGTLTILLNVTVVLLVAALANRHYGFFVSWQDLLTPDPPMATTSQGASNFTPQTSSPAASPPATLPPLPVPGSRTQTFQVTGPRSGITNQVDVFLPPGYDPAAPQTYPVIMALHGFPGGPQQFTSLGMNDLVDRAAAARTMRHAIVIAPQINSPSTVDTECVNAPGGLQTETWLAEDVPEFARTHFRVAQGPGSWATFGFSYGGWCAAMTTVRHPDVFGAAIVMQGYFRPELTPGYQPFQPGSAAWQSYDLARIAEHTPPPVALWLLTSRNDPPSYAQATRLEHAARAPLSVTNNVITGGHRVEVWAPHVPEAFAWLGAALPGFTP